jgi:hypothetical protein
VGPSWGFPERRHVYLITCFDAAPCAGGVNWAVTSAYLARIQLILGVDAAANV